MLFQTHPQILITMLTASSEGISGKKAELAQHWITTNFCSLQLEEHSGFLLLSQPADSHCAPDVNHLPYQQCPTSCYTGNCHPADAWGHAHYIKTTTNWLMAGG